MPEEVVQIKPWQRQSYNDQADHFQNRPKQGAAVRSESLIIIATGILPASPPL
ncbi:hypothetical protein BDQ94DRAFT_147017 [Aspergillus welwitschiae]|uniref:Uncharacterized protein n=1 Tax=Aspergillus welwitschiae TaxID=1341132 RepID=A0A3F3PXE9_9EURO|nr:hypothetical protein BDQ94DRAFT_147017 [Aspergillus welwitschiae]RDH31583.1 hypothetical protein BDQ94DRAFT_147017 [Aspergillus welwitschiae]